jgi:anti-sigma regulatory factor (Ser/Thr protein kinase)
MQATSMIPLVVIHPHVERLLHPKELIVMGDENIAEPFDLRALLSIVESEAMRAAEERLLLRHVVHYQLPTVDAWIEDGIDLFARCVRASGLTEEQQVALSSAVKEAVTNAAMHGNKSRSEKKIEVQYVLDADKVAVTVRDYGTGFDHRQFVTRGKDGSALAAARQRHQEGRLGGLGIMLMLRCCDNVEYASVGNRVTLTKILPGRRPQGKA